MGRTLYIGPNARSFSAHVQGSLVELLRPRPIASLDQSARNAL
jgi:hypothetical protein